MSTLLSSAEHWEAIAASAEEMAKWDREHGLDLSAPGQSVGGYQAEVYRRCARTLRLEHETGEPHCMCHETPKSICPFSQMGVLV